MSKALEKAHSNEPIDIQSRILDIVADPNIDPDRLEKFLDLQFKVEARQAEVAFNDALARFQDECPAIIKDKKVSFKQTNYAYAQLDEMVCTIRPIMAKYGLSFSFNIKSIDPSTNELVTTVKHKAGHSVESSYFFDPMSEGGAMNGSQRRKSALTYAKRAGLENALGLVTANEDDDARRATDNPADSEQVELIEGLIKETSTDKKALLNYFKADSVKDLTYPQAKECITLLRQKKGE